MIKFGFSPLPYRVTNHEIKLSKYKPKNLRDKKKHDMYNRRLLNSCKKMVIKVTLDDYDTSR